MSYIQQFFTSRDNNANSETFVGQVGRLWWDPVTNQIYSSDGNTPGGIPLSGSGGNGTPGGSNSQVQFNQAGSFGGSAFLTFSSVTGTLTTVAVSAIGNVVGNYFFGNGSQLTGLPATYGNADVATYLASGTDSLDIVTTANVSGNYILGNGALLTGVATSMANINNGTSNVTVVSSGGNIAVGVGGTGNVAVFAASGEYVTGVLSVSGNVTGENILTSGSISATGNVSTGANLSVTGSITVGAVGASSVSASGNVTGNYIIGNGSQLTGLSASYTNANVVTLLSSFGSNVVSTTGNVTAGYFVGNGSLLSSITGANVTGTVANASYAVSAGSSTTAATVTDAAQPNITSVGTLTSITITGNVTGGNLSTGGLISATGNITGGNLNAAGLSLSGNVVGAINSTANIITTGNIRAGNLIGSNLTATRIPFVGTNGVITDSIVMYTDQPNQLLYVGGGGAYIGGTGGFGTVNATRHEGSTMSATGNITGGNINTGGSVRAASVSASGNVTGGNLNAAGLSLSSNVVSALNVTGAIAGANLTTPGLISATGNITGGNVNVGNITIATDLISSANSIITIDPATVGNAGLVVINGNLQVNGTTTTINSNVVSTNDLTVNYANNAINGAAANGGGIEIGPIGSPFITWLYNNSANAWVSTGGVSAVGNIDGGNLNASVLSLSSNVVSALNVTGAIAGANVTTPGLISATGNITGGNLITSAAISAASVSASGNITGGNILGGANVNATTHTGTTVSVTGNITGGNLIISGSITDSGQLDISTTASNGNIVLTPNGTGNVNTGANVIVTGNITGGNILGGANVNATTHTGTTVSVTGAITGGSLTVSTGNITGGNIVNANGNGIGNIGSASVYFNTVFAKATSAQYADLAEKYTADAEYTSGTVLSFGGPQEVTVTLTDADHRVAGVVSTNPATIMNAGLDSEHVVIVALLGRVPCSVTGTVRKGDSMVSAGNGAARAEANPAVSTVIGKALEDFDGESGVIEVAVGVG